jgi:hypothetical protein
MSNSEHPTAGSDAHRPFRCTFGPVHERDLVGPQRERDLVWPPPDEEIDAFTVVQLDGSEAPTPRATLPAPPPPPQSRPPLKPTFGDCRAPDRAPRLRPMVVPREPLPLTEGETAAGPVAQPVGAAAPAIQSDGDHAHRGPTEPEIAPLAEPGLDPATGALMAAAAEPAAELALEPTLAPVPAAAPTAAAPTAAAPTAAAAAAAPDDPELILTASRSAWLAVVLAAACAILAVAEYRLIFSDQAEAGVAVAEPPPAPQELSTSDLAPSVSRTSPPPIVPTPAQVPASPAPTPVVENPAVQVATARPPVPSVVPARPTPRPTEPRAVEPPAVVARAERTIATPPAPVTVARAERPVVTPPRGATATVTEVATPAPTPTPAAGSNVRVASATAPAPTAAAERVPEPVRESAPVAVTAAVNSANPDETDIRTTLTRFRTAYSQLNARAARDVWPSVDARALERAFQSLKSQELRFDHCSLTVTGARAQAACKGRATYVPRIGDQSPRYTAREWAFELKKADEGWTIASARTL